MYFHSLICKHYISPVLFPSASSWFVLMCMQLEVCSRASIFDLKIPVCQSAGWADMLKVAVKDGVCVSPHNIMTSEEAQATISQQPLFAPQNEALQDNEHFKAATPTTPKTCLSQHSDTGREREVAGEKGGVSWICQSHTFCLGPQVLCSGLNSSPSAASETMLITQLLSHNPFLVCPSWGLAESVLSGLSCRLCVNSHIVCLTSFISLAYASSQSLSCVRQSKILITKSEITVLPQFLFMMTWLDNEK